jgi:hypothetical protein
MSEDNQEKTPLEVIVHNVSFVKTEVISVMMQISSTIKEYDKDLQLVDEAIRSVEDEEAISEIRVIREGILERKAKYLSQVLFCQLQLKETVNLINEQLMRQVPTEKRVTLLIDFEQLVEDCKHSQ